MPSASLRSTVENSRTSSGRPMGVPSCIHRPSLRMTMSISPQWGGFQRWTGGSWRAEDSPAPGAGAWAAAISCESASVMLKT